MPLAKSMRVSVFGLSFSDRVVRFLFDIHAKRAYRAKQRGSDLYLRIYVYAHAVLESSEEEDGAIGNTHVEEMSAPTMEHRPPQHKDHKPSNI